MAKREESPAGLMTCTFRQPDDAKETQPWTATAKVFIYDVHGNAKKVRLLIDSKEYRCGIRESVLKSMRWDTTDNKKKGCEGLEQITSAVNNECVVRFEILDDSFLEYLPPRIRKPVLSAKSYDAFIHYCYDVKTSMADIDLGKKSVKWLNIDGIIGSDWFEDFEISPINYRMTPRFCIRDSNIGVLLAINK